MVAGAAGDRETSAIPNAGVTMPRVAEALFPLDRLERLAKQWLMLRQQAGVEEYREEFCLLQAAYPLGERAEFMLAYHGLKPNMRAEVREALDEEEQEQLPCDKLFALARKAEIRSFRDDHSQTATARDSFRGERKTTTQVGHRAGTNPARDHNQHSSRTSPSETRTTQTRKVNVDRASLLKEYPCWVCDQKGHFTRDCPAAKKQGCFRCGEAHTLRDCPKRLAKTRTVQRVSLNAADDHELQYTVRS